jgi:hypothetical protein
MLLFLIYTTYWVDSFTYNLLLTALCPQWQQKLFVLVLTFIDPFVVFAQQACCCLPCMVVQHKHRKLLFAFILDRNKPRFKIGRAIVSVVIFGVYSCIFWVYWKYADEDDNDNLPDHICDFVLAFGALAAYIYTIMAKNCSLPENFDADVYSSDIRLVFHPSHPILTAEAICTELREIALTKKRGSKLTKNWNNEDYEKLQEVYARDETLLLSN